MGGPALDTLVYVLVGGVAAVGVFVLLVLTGGFQDLWEVMTRPHDHPLAHGPTTPPPRGPGDGGADAVGAPVPRPRVPPHLSAKARRAIPDPETCRATGPVRVTGGDGC